MKFDSHTKRICINGVKTKYAITDDGKVYSLDYKHTGKVVRLKTRLDVYGYEIATIYVNGKRKDYKVHRLVAIHFIKNPDPENKIEVNHKDGVKTNNTVSNLEWVTNQENTIHAWKHNLITPKVGEDNPTAKYINDQIIKVCSMIEKNKHSLHKIADKTGVSAPVVAAIYYRKLWKSVSKDYDFSKFDKFQITKLTENQVKEVCELLQKGEMTMKEIAEKLKIDVKRVWKIFSRNSYQDISKDYDFSNYKINFMAYKVNKNGIFTPSKSF